MTNTGPKPTKNVNPAEGASVHVQVNEGTQGATGRRSRGLAVVAQLLSQNLAHEVTCGQRGENHRHGNNPAVECAGTGEGVMRRVQQEGEQGCHVHGGHADGVDYVVEPLTGRGGCTGHSSNLAVSGIQTVTESEKAMQRRYPHQR